MDKQARIERISLMENRFDGATRVLGELDEAISGYEDFKSALEALKDYMASGEWKEDYEADEAGMVPADLKRGVLSQDGLYNLLQDADRSLCRALGVLGEALGDLPASPSFSLCSFFSVASLHPRRPLSHVSCRIIPNPAYRTFTRVSARTTSAPDT